MIAVDTNALMYACDQVDRRRQKVALDCGLLHPRVADIYREKVGGPCQALESEESRAGAREAIRALIEASVLEPRWRTPQDYFEGRFGRHAARNDRTSEEAAGNGDLFGR